MTFHHNHSVRPAQTGQMFRCLFADPLSPPSHHSAWANRQDAQMMMTPRPYCHVGPGDTHL